MSTAAWILMALVMTVVWGGWILTLWFAVRQERRRRDNQTT